MLSYVKYRKLLRKPQRSLLTCFSSEEILLSTDYLLFLIDHNVIVTEVKTVFQCGSTDILSTYINSMTEERRTGDRQGSFSHSLLQLIILLLSFRTGNVAMAMNAKLSVNSWYNKTLLIPPPHVNLPANKVSDPPYYSISVMVSCFGIHLA